MMKFKIWFWKKIFSIGEFLIYRTPWYWCGNRLEMVSLDKINTLKKAEWLEAIEE